MGAFSSMYRYTFIFAGEKVQKNGSEENKLKPI